MIIRNKYCTESFLYSIVYSIPSKYLVHERNVIFTMILCKREWQLSALKGGQKQGMVSASVDTKLMWSQSKVENVPPAAY